MKAVADCFNLGGSIGKIVGRIQLIQQVEERLSPKFQQAGLVGVSISNVRNGKLVLLLDNPASSQRVHYFMHEVLSLLKPLGITAFQLKVL